MSSDEYRLVTEYGRVDYPCGLSAGDRLRVKVAIVVHQGSKPTGVVYPVGDVWTVLRGESSTNRISSGYGSRMDNPTPGPATTFLRLLRK